MIKRMGNITGKTAIILAVMALVLYAADDAKMKLTDSAGVSCFAVQDSTGATVFRINSDGNVTLGAWQGTDIAVADGGTGAGTFTAGYLKANGTNAFTTLATIPNTDGGTGLNTSGSTGVPSISAGTWSVNATLGLTLGGTGQTTANAAFNALAPAQTGNAGKFLTTNATNTSWGTSVSGAIINLNASSNFATNINTGTSTGTVSIGSTTGTAGISLRVGTGNYSLDGVTNSTYAMGASTTTGTITIGGTAQTGALTLGSSSGAQTVNVGTGAGIATVNIATGDVAGVVKIGDNTGATSSTVLIGGSVVTNGAFNYAADAQASDTYVITLAPAPTAYVAGMYICFKANTANTTGCTINVNGLGAKAIVKRLNTTLATGDILAGMLVLIVYDGTNFIMMNPVVN